MQQNPDLIKVIEYMKAHWPSQVKPEWQSHRWAFWLW